MLSVSVRYSGIGEAPGLGNGFACGGSGGYCMGATGADRRGGRAMDAPIERGVDHGWRQRLWVIVFRADTPGGRAFDVALITAILASVVTVTLESVASVRAAYGPLLHAVEWAFTVLFTA